jgi:hypothetical protein
LQDEVDHVAFGLACLRRELAGLSEQARQDTINSIPARLDYLDDSLHNMGVDVPAMFKAVGADYQAVVHTVLQRRQALMDSLQQLRAA